MEYGKYKVGFILLEGFIDFNYKKIIVVVESDFLCNKMMKIIL